MKAKKEWTNEKEWKKKIKKTRVKEKRKKEQTKMKAQRKNDQANWRNETKKNERQYKKVKERKKDADSAHKNSTASVSVCTFTATSSLCVWILYI